MYQRWLFNCFTQAHAKRPWFSPIHYIGSRAWWALLLISACGLALSFYEYHHFGQLQEFYIGTFIAIIPLFVACAYASQTSFAENIFVRAVGFIGSQYMLVIYVIHLAFVEIAVHYMKIKTGDPSFLFTHDAAFGLFGFTLIASILIAAFINLLQQFLRASIRHVGHNSSLK